jgi:hypothetical protein
VELRLDEVLRPELARLERSELPQFEDSELPRLELSERLALDPNRPVPVELPPVDPPSLGPGSDELPDDEPVPPLLPTSEEVSPPDELPPMTAEELRVATPEGAQPAVNAPAKVRRIKVERAVPTEVWPGYLDRRPMLQFGRRRCPIACLLSPAPPQQAEGDDHGQQGASARRAGATAR